MMAAIMLAADADAPIAVVAVCCGSQALFRCVSFIFKHLARLLVADLPNVLKMTVGMR